MTALMSAVLIVGTLGVLNLLLTFGVIRRLREQSRAATGGASAMSASPVMSPPGTSVGHPGVDLSEETLVGFFAPGCDACDRQLPEFLADARSRDRVVAVVSGGDDEGREVAGRLRAVAEVVVEDRVDGAMQRGFGVKGFPAYCLVRDGVIVAVAPRAADLPRRKARLRA
ncbi:hypothetical protein ACFY2R_20445 [Micromonospora olivasterospora]|uniref:Thiol-disulfide isomerase/thioredoxin n=1 Tax=Micromonospora olivasterospora TaxID=1880 RepID=A0A562IH92_MICOL|nr:hypothetical protein [Micromonospora olivasterospora]TWH70389.1 hypothetical protein JD77_05414 [Micromonospora olivasterospora]